MEKNNDKMAKLALEADGNVVGESFIIRPDKNLAGKLGVLFGVIEIYNVNDAFLDGFLNAVNDLKTEYYLPPFSADRGVEKRFEEAISRANRRIFSAVTQSIEEIDLRNISAAIGLFHEDKVYLSSAGRIKGLFFRRKKNGEMLIIDILSGNGETRYRPEPEKIFANILSGELSQRDAVLLINEEFLGVFSQKDLGETVLDRPATAAIKAIDDSLREKVAKKNFYAVVVAPAAMAEEPVPIKVMPTDQASGVSTKPFRDNPIIGAASKPITGRIAADAQPLPQARKNLPTQQSIDRLIITQVRTEKYLTPSLLPQWQKVILVAGTSIKTGSLAALGVLNKLISASAKFISQWIDSRKSQPDKAIKNEQLKTESIDSKATAAAEIIPADLELENEAIIDLPKDLKPDLEPEPIDSEILAESPAERPAILIEEIAVKAPRPEGKVARSINLFLNNQAEKFLALKRGQQVILALGLILLYLFSLSVVMIGRASDKSPAGTSASDIIARQIQEQLDSAEAQNIFNDELGAIRSIKKARELLAELPERRFNKSFKNDLADKIAAAATKLQRITLIDNPAAAADYTAEAAPSTLAGLARTGKVLWAYDNQSRTLLRLDTATNAITKVTTSLPQLRQLAAIDDKNLALSEDGKTFYKYDITKNAAAKFKPTKDYFHIKLPVTASPLIDPPLASSTFAMSVESGGYSFYLDGINGRIVVLDKNGSVKRQYYGETLKNAAAFVADYKSKKLWCFSGGKAYLIDLDF